MSLPSISKDNLKLTDDQVHAATQKVIQSIFSKVKINGYAYTENEIWNVLLYASANRISIKAACERLKDDPSYNWMYTFLKQEVLGSYALESLEQQGNQGLQITLPKRLNKRAQKLAIDLVLIPYYGDEETCGIYRSQVKRSTTKFFCYASAYVIKKNKRTTVCFTFVQPDDTLLEVLTRLLERVENQGIRLKRLYLDRQFAQVDVLQYLALQPCVSVVAIPKKGSAIKALQRGKKSYQTHYTMRSAKYGHITFPLWMGCRYQKGRAKRHGVQYLFFAVLGDCRSSALQIAEEYRHRFGIETSYRIMNQARAKTTSRSPEIRLLLVAIAFLLSNVWVWFKWNLLLIWRRQQRKKLSFTLDIFCHFIGKQVENIYGTIECFKL